MTTLEIIDRLCTVIEAQAKIIRTQVAFINEQLSVDEELKKQLFNMNEPIDADLDVLEYHLRSLHHTQKG